MKKIITPFDFRKRLFRKMLLIKSKLFYTSKLKKCGKGNRIVQPLYITPKCIIFGNNISIWKNARIEGVNRYEGVYFQPEIVFHNNVSVQQNLHLTCAFKIEIGENTAIAANVTITDIHHPYEDINLPIEKQKIRVSAVSISSDCKIYNNVVILPGCKIGKHSTIGANSVVSGLFPDYCVIVGAPAKIIKRYSFEKEAWLKTDAKGDFVEE